jgi:hypothetical protein
MEFKAISQCSFHEAEESKAYLNVNPKSLPRTWIGNYYLSNFQLYRAVIFIS